MEKIKAESGYISLFSAATTILHQNIIIIRRNLFTVTATTDEGFCLFLLHTGTILMKLHNAKLVDLLSQYIQYLSNISVVSIVTV